jgi:predicted RNase H-like HicB family nuclease
MLNTIKDTTKHVYWNGRESCFVAVMSESPMCRAEGASPAEALENVERAYARDIRGTLPAPQKAPVAATAAYVTA